VSRLGLFASLDVRAGVLFQIKHVLADNLGNTGACALIRWMFKPKAGAADGTKQSVQAKHDKAVDSPWACLLNGT